jgi:UDPglucose 6-dehydrogenase
MAEKEPIGVIGVGWVGLVTAACFADLGHEVVARDILQEKVDSLSRGEVPMFEPGLPELLEKNRERLTFTTDMAPVLERTRLLFCCVDTPPTYSGDADLSRVETVVEEVGDSREHALVMKSTVPVGTGRSIGRRSDGLGYVSNPEFLKEGTAVSDFLKPDRVVIGANGDSRPFGDRVAALYEPLEAPIVRTDVASAEMVKLASNAFLATKISFINEIANVSEEVGADVVEVARGMGLDERIGSQFLRAGIGWGGSCLAGEETILVRSGDQVWMTRLDSFFETLEVDMDLVDLDPEVLFPHGLDVLAWRQGSDAPEFLPLAAATRRHYDGDLLTVRTKMGRRVRCTADHPFVATGPDGGEVERKLAEELTENDWLPIAQGAPSYVPAPEKAGVCLAGMLSAGLESRDVIVRPTVEALAPLATMTLEERGAAIDHRRGSRTRLHDIVRSGALRLDETAELGLSLEGASIGTATNGTYVPTSLQLDEAFWRVAGLYTAEGHASADGRRLRLVWSFHPTKEQDLVEEVAEYWRARGVKATVRRSATAMNVSISSRLLGHWWTEAFGMGRNCYEQRVPDPLWGQPESHKRAFLTGLWLGDGSWSPVNGGPSVIMEYGTASPELADGVLRLLGEFGIVASQRIGRTAKSTVDTHWLRISGADQVECMLDLVPERDRIGIRTALSLQSKRIAPTGYRRRDPHAAWARVVGVDREPYAGPVYSLKIPDANTFVTTGGLVTSNCFPKDTMALKQLAGNSGYHFQLLTSVIEVNELQKRRTVGKLQKHLGSLVGKTIALLGISFKPNTDDVREATSLVLAARLHGEGANVRAYDPVAGEPARELLKGSTICDSALEALDGADGAVLVTEWPEFADLDWAGEVKKRMNTPLLVDGRNFLDRDELEAAGFTYEGVGR